MSENTSVNTDIARAFADLDITWAVDYSGDVQAQSGWFAQFVLEDENAVEAMKKDVSKDYELDNLKPGFYLLHIDNDGNKTIYSHIDEKALDRQYCTLFAQYLEWEGIAE